MVNTKYAAFKLKGTQVRINMRYKDNHKNTIHSCVDYTPAENIDAHAILVQISRVNLEEHGAKSETVR